MGHPKRIRKKYNKPSHPWQKLRIDEERELKRKFGLKNKKEIWKAESRLRKIRRQARHLLAQEGSQADIESKQLLDRLDRYGIAPSGISLGDVLSLSIQDILKRRLQSLVLEKGLAKSAKQARQFIIQGHITLDGRRITVPSYLIRKEEEEVISFNEYSPIADESHPMRIQKVEEVKEEVREDNGKEK